MSVGLLLVSFRGRVNRAQFWLALLICAAIESVVLFINSRGPGIFGLWHLMLNLAAPLVALVFALAAGAKRLHDRDKTAWWLVLFYIVPIGLIVFGLDLSMNPAQSPIEAVSVGVAAVIALWALVELGCRRGTVGPNRYGPDPLPK